MTDAIAPGETFAGYRIESRIGRGGMGVVYRATDLALDRPVALKLIAPELAQDARFRARFLKEQRLAAALDHPSVVPIYEAGERDGQLYLAMRFVAGSDLKTVLARDGALAPARSLAILAQIADALDAAHRRGLVHRDVKPGNVLLDEDGHAYLTDFGVTKRVGTDSTDTGAMVGTLDYLAPEQIRGEPVDGRADGYALACVLYETLSGAPPFRRDTEAATLWAHLQEPPPRLRAYPALDHVLRTGLAKDRDERPPTGAELIDAASAALGLEAPARRGRRRRTGKRLVLAGVVLISAAAAAATVLERAPETASTTAQRQTVAPDSVGVLDPRSDRVVGHVTIPGRPYQVAARGRAVWVASEASRTISRIDGRSLSVTDVVPTGASAWDLGAGPDAAWLIDAERELVVKAETDYDAGARRRPLPERGPTALGAGLGVAPGAVWAADGTTRLLKLDPRDAGVLRRFDVRQPVDDVAAGMDGIWAISRASAEVLEVDPRDGSVRARIPIVGRAGSTRPSPFAVAVGEGAVWTLNDNAASVSRIDPRLAAVRATIPLGVGSNPLAIATGEGAVWVALNGEGAVARIDPDTGAVRKIPVGGAPTGVAVGSGRVWVSVQPAFRANTASAPRTVEVEGAIAPPICAPVEYAPEGSPQFLIVSDLPLQVLTPQFQPLQFSDAVRYVLAQHDYRAGRYRVGYQSCDHSGGGAAEPTTPASCRRNARAIAGAPLVLGMIGPFTSSCAIHQVRILNAARGAPLATVSATATLVGLTHAGPGAAPGEPDVYYPRGTRNFARVLAADDVQGAADAMMAQRLGVKRLYVLDNGAPYGAGIAEIVRRTGRELGLTIAGSGRWDPLRPGFARLAGRVERSGADGVFLGGVLGANEPRLIRELRAVLGARGLILAPDGFSEFTSLTRRAGRAAEGMVVSISVVPTARLPAAGRRFAAAFSKAIGSPAPPLTITTAQATEVLLAAIAASDGTRASVTAQLLKTRVEDGILGDFAFDANGDTTAGAVTMYRVERGRERVVDVITPPASLR